MSQPQQQLMVVDPSGQSGGSAAPSRLEGALLSKLNRVEAALSGSAGGSQRVWPIVLTGIGAGIAGALAGYMVGGMICRMRRVVGG